MGLGWGYGLGGWVSAQPRALSWVQVGTEGEFPFGPGRAWLPRLTAQWGQQGRPGLPADGWSIMIFLSRVLLAAGGLAT